MWLCICVNVKQGNVILAESQKNGQRSCRLTRYIIKLLGHNYAAWLSSYQIWTPISHWEKQDSDSNTKGSPTDTYLNQRNANSYTLQTLHPWTLLTETNNIAKITGQVSSHITQWFKPLVCIFSSRWEIWVQLFPCFCVVISLDVPGIFIWKEQHPLGVLQNSHCIIN